MAVKTENAYFICREKNLPQLPSEALKTPLPALEEGEPETAAQRIAALEAELNSAKIELLDTQLQLDNANSTISILQGLVGSLKSAILFLDNVRGQSFLNGEIAAMESLLFDGSEIQQTESETAAETTMNGYSRNSKSSSTKFDSLTKSGQSSGTPNFHGDKSPLEANNSFPNVDAEHNRTVHVALPTTAGSQTHPSPSKLAGSSDWKEFQARVQADNKLTQDMILREALKRKKQHSAWGIFS